jgi:hypothetical protein
MFNEPDGTWASNKNIMGTWGHYGADYAAMLKAVYPAVKAADPGSQVVFGGLAYSSWVPFGQFIEGLLDDVLRAGGGDYFDILNYHYYEVTAPQWNPYGSDILGKTSYLRQKLAEYGVTDKPIICSEAGAFGQPADPAQMETQAQYVAKLYARGLAGGLPAVIWYSLHEGTDQTGLVHAGVAKPAYAAFQTMSRLLTGQRFSRAVSAEEVSPDPAAPVPAFEGYAFHLQGRSDDLWVIWLNQGSASIAVRAQSVEVVDKFGDGATLQAGPDGLVHLPLTTSPLYVRY